MGNMFLILMALFITFGTFIRAVSQSATVVCTPGRCVQGHPIISVGAELSVSGQSTTIQLLPGQYTSVTSPQLLHTFLTSSSATLIGSPGFQSGPLSLPLDLQLQPGISTYSQILYSGSASFEPLPSSPLNESIPLSASSIAISPNILAIVSSNNQRFVLWDSVPDTSQLSSTGPLSLLDIQSSACSPPCSSSGICSASGTCICPTGFNGTLCESCAEGFFGPICQPCSSGCSTCDQGISGSGRCLSVANDTTECNCLNGQCQSSGGCTCNTGWTTGDNGVLCSKCAPGFFLSDSGDCQVCPIGCSQCEDNTGTCITCASGFSQDDKKTCNRIPHRIAPPCNGRACKGIDCGAGFVTGGRCNPCPSVCKSCSGPNASDCTECASGYYFFNGMCVPADSDGTCQSAGAKGTYANSNTGQCNTCGAKCMSCKVSTLSTASTIGHLCTSCTSGHILFKGTCIATCPAGTFISSRDTTTCSACASQCKTCTSSADFCTSCVIGQLVSAGKCVSTCPSNTYTSPTSCNSCHPDCLTCSGPSFDQCKSCPTSRPVLTNGRCLSTCSKSQYFDKMTSTCRACDSSCASCSASSPGNCLSCSSSAQVLQRGACVAANCQVPTSVIPGLGVCLSGVVENTPASVSGSGTVASPLPLPSTTGLTEPVAATSRARVPWWQILLMTLGCIFIFVVIVFCWRKEARKRREKETKTFAREKNLDRPHGWWGRLGERLFGQRRHDVAKSDLPVAHGQDVISRRHHLKDATKISPRTSQETHRKSANSKDEYTRRLKAHVQQNSELSPMKTTSRHRHQLSLSDRRRPTKQDSMDASIDSPLLPKKPSRRGELVRMEHHAVPLPHHSPPFSGFSHAAHPRFAAPRPFGAPPIFAENVMLVQAAPRVDPYWFTPAQYPVAPHLPPMMFMNDDDFIPPPMHPMHPDSYNSYR